LDIDCRVLMFTMHESERLTAEVRGAGAQGFVLKSQAARDLVRAIDQLLEGDTFFGETPERKPEKKIKSESNSGTQFCLAFALGGI